MMNAKDHSHSLLPPITGGLLIGISEVIFAISMSSLVFSGNLSAHFGQGVGIMLVTAAISMIFVALFSAIPGIIGSLQDSPTVILAVIAATLVSTSSNIPPQQQFITLLAIISLSALLTGGLFLGLGALKLGGLVRFFPYPVLGGFLAGTGWLLAQGSFSAMADYPLTFGNLILLLQPDQVLQWVPGVLFALILFAGMKRSGHYLTMPLILITAIILFYLLLLVTGNSIEQAVQKDLLLGGMGGEASWQPFSLQSWMAADWTAILGQSGTISIIVILSLLSLLLNTSALELLIEKDVDFNRELRTAGAATLLSGLGGGTVGYHTLSATILSFRIGARSRITGVAAGLLCGLVLILGSQWLSYFPKFILGGLLLYLGLDFLDEWVLRGWKKLLPLDYGVVLGILVVIAVTDFLTGVVVGLVATVLLFVVKYSQVKILRYSLSGADLQSNVERHDLQRQKLKELGAQIYILELQGFIFFGTASALLSQIKARLSDASQPPARYILLDFRYVSGLDSSAVFSFIKARQVAAVQGTVLVLCSIADPIRKQLQVGGLFDAANVIQSFADLDRGLEWCEDRLLERAGMSQLPESASLAERLVASGFKEQAVSGLMPFLERIELAKGEYLIHQGDESDSLYLIGSGRLSIYLERDGESSLRLQSSGTRTMVGELGIYLGIPRTASIIADEPSVAYRLTQSALAEMEEKEPAVAAAFFDYSAHQLAQQLVETDQLLSKLMR